MRRLDREGEWDRFPGAAIVSRTPLPAAAALSPFLTENPNGIDFFPMDIGKGRYRPDRPRRYHRGGDLSERPASPSRVSGR